MSKQEYRFRETLGYHLGTTARTLSGRLNKKLTDSGENISFEQYVILVRLWEKEGISQQELAEDCGKDKTTITRLLDLLEKENVIVRKEDRSDRRNKQIFLTSRGKGLKKKLVPLALQTMAEAQKGISKKDLDLCIGVLKKIKSNLLL
jgi:DNA-binding MarR family transcriptional regulator